MTTHVHDTPLKLCRERPQLAVELADRLFGVPIPDHDQILPYSESATDPEIRDLNADNVVLCQNGKENQLGIIIEVQRERDRRKSFSWPAYQVNIRHRINAPVVLIVVCPKAATAEWAAEAIETGHPGFTFRPLVLGPHNYPKYTEPSGDGTLADHMVLGTLIHELSDDIQQLIKTTNQELSWLPPERATRYAKYMLGHLSERPRAILEALMKQETYPFQSKFVADLKAEGRVEEATGMLLEIIETRGLRFTENDRRRIEGCGDLAQLRAWTKLAITARSAADIFG